MSATVTDKIFKQWEYEAIMWHRFLTNKANIIGGYKTTRRLLAVTPAIPLFSYLSLPPTKFLLWVNYAMGNLKVSSCCKFFHRIILKLFMPLLWRHNGRDGITNHQPHDCLLNRLFRRRSKKTSKLHVTGLCVGNSPMTGEFPAQKASDVENVSIWWRHHAWQVPPLALTLQLAG